MRSVLAFAVLVSSLLAHAQQHPPAKPADELKNFKPLMGEWTVSGAFNHENQKVNFTGSGKGSMTLGGKFVRLEFDLKGTPMGDVSFEAMLNYDAEKKTYRGVFFISEEPMPLAAVGSFDGKKFVFKGTPPDSESTIQIVFDVSKLDQFSLTVTEDHGAGFENNDLMSATFTKKKS